MGDETALPVVDNDQTHGSNVLEIYPLSWYYFGSTRALPFKDETLSDRLHRLKSNYAAHGMRTCVEAVILSTTRITKMNSAQVVSTRMDMGQSIQSFASALNGATVGTLWDEFPRSN